MISCRSSSKQLTYEKHEKQALTIPHHVAHQWFFGMGKSFLLGETRTTRSFVAAQIP
jgi:hypothetical protein